MCIFPARPFTGVFKMVLTSYFVLISTNAILANANKHSNTEKVYNGLLDGGRISNWRNTGKDEKFLTVKGIVKAEGGKPLDGATVLVKGTKTSVQTDADG